MASITVGSSTVHAHHPVVQPLHNRAPTSGVLTKVNEVKKATLETCISFTSPLLGSDTAVAIDEAIKAHSNKSDLSKEKVKKSIFLFNIALLKASNSILQTANKTISAAALSLKLFPFFPFIAATFGVGGFGLYFFANSIAKGTKQMHFVDDGPLAALTAEIEVKKREFKQISTTYRVDGDISKSVERSQKVSKYLGAWFSFVSKIIPDEKSIVFFKDWSGIFNGTFYAFDGLSEMISAIEIVPNLSKLFGKMKGKTLWQHSKLDFGSTLASTVSSFASIRLFLAKSEIWRDSETTLLIWSNIKNIATIAAASFRLVKHGKNIYVRSIEIRDKTLWRKAVKLDEAVQNNKTAAKLVKQFQKYYEKKLRHVQKRQSSHVLKKARYSSYLNALAANSPHALKNFYDLKRTSIDLKPMHKRGQIAASQCSNADLLAYKAINAKRAITVAAKNRNKSIMGVLNDTLLCTVIGTATVLMFTPAGMGVQLSMAVAGISLNTVGFVRYLNDQRKPPVYEKLRFSLIAKRRLKQF